MGTDRIRCFVINGRTGLINIVGQKLGAEYRLEAIAMETLKLRDDCDVIVFCVSHPNSPEHSVDLELLSSTCKSSAGIPVVAFIANPDSALSRELVTRGAYDHICETQSLDEFRIVLRRAAECRKMVRELRRYQRVEPATVPTFSDYLGNDPKLAQVLSFARRIAPTDVNVLITGETGTGKELMARAIHKGSSRAEQPFVAVACSSLPESLIESELFGHEKGAFTGASGARKGRFEAAEGGTIFLDEIGELSFPMQVKLLRVLQERTFERLGSNEQRPMNARVICATNRDLRTMAREGQFRIDLYYRVNTVEINIPPLRERRDDIMVLASAFVKQTCEQQRVHAREISPAAILALTCYSWPGNVRELQHVIERAVVICDADEIQLEHLPPEILADIETAAECVNVSPSWVAGSFDEEVRNFKRQLIARALHEAGANKVRAARTLKISRSSLHRLIEELDVNDGSSWGARRAS